jgi:hypothetical protein
MYNQLRDSSFVDLGIRCIRGYKTEHENKKERSPKNIPRLRTGDPAPGVVRGQQHLFLRARTTNPWVYDCVTGIGSFTCGRNLENPHITAFWATNAY